MEMFETLTGLASRDPPSGKLTKNFLAFHVSLRMLSCLLELVEVFSARNEERQI